MENHESDQTSSDAAGEGCKQNLVIYSDLSDQATSNPLLERLLAEVKFENESNILAYNRTHNRHNRGR